MIQDRPDKTREQFSPKQIDQNRQYLKKRQRRRLITAAMVVLTVAVVGFAVVQLRSFLQTSGSNDTTAGGAPYEVLRSAILGLFNADKSVNYDKVHEWLYKFGADKVDLVRRANASYIDTAEERGDITAKQATELRKAMGIQ